MYVPFVNPPPSVISSVPSRVREPETTVGLKLVPNWTVVVAVFPRVNWFENVIAPSELNGLKKPLTVTLLTIVPKPCRVPKQAVIPFNRPPAILSVLVGIIVR